MTVAEEWLGAATMERAVQADGIGDGDLDAARESGLLRFEGDGVTVRNRLVRSSLWADATREERQDAHTLLAGVLVQEWQRPRRLWHGAAVVGEPDDGLAAELAGAAAAARRAGRYADSWRMWQRAATLTVEHGARTDRYLAAAGDAWASGRSRRARAMLRQVRPRGSDGTRIARAAALRGEIETAAGSPAAAVPVLRDAAERLAGADAGAALDALMWAAEAADASGDHRAHLEIAERARALDLPAPGPRTELLLAHLGGVAAAIRGRYREAAERFGHAARLGPDVADPAAQAWAALAALALGDGARTRALAAEAVASARRSGDAPAESFALVATGRCAVLLGHPPAPITACHDGLRLARATRLHGHATEQLATLALTAAFNGDEARTRELLEQLTGTADERGLARAAALGSWAPACLDLAADRPADAAARLRLPGGAGLAHPPARLLAVPHLVEALVRTGEHEPAAGAYEHFRRWVDGIGSPPDRRRSAAAAWPCWPDATTRPRSTSPRPSACTRPPAPCSSWPARSCCSGTGCGAGDALAPPASTCAPRSASSSATAPPRGRHRPAPSCAPPGRPRRGRRAGSASSPRSRRTSPGWPPKGPPTGRSLRACCSARGRSTTISATSSPASGSARASSWPG